jgi:hypothetical protein
MTIRTSFINFFGNSVDYIASNSIGPMMTGDSFLGNSSSWVAYNGSSLSQQSDYIVITSSGQLKNCQYQEISVTPGTRYRLTGNAYYQTQDVQTRIPPDTTDQACFISVGTDIAASDLAYYAATVTDQVYTLDFTPETNTVFVSAGFGDLSYSLFISNSVFRELVPVHSYNQKQGTFYLSWNAVAAPSTLLQLQFNGTTISNVSVDSANSIFINGVNSGSQSAVNKIAFTYNSNSVLFSRNGNSVNSSLVTLPGNTTSFVFPSVIKEFSYTPTIVSNSTMIGITNV